MRRTFSRSSDSRIESYLVGKCRRVSPHKPAAVPSQHRIFIASSIGHAQLYVKKNSRAASITNKLSNSSAKRRVGCPSSDFPTIFSATFASPPFPSSPGISIPIDSHSEGLLMAGNQDRRSLRIREKRAKQNRRMSFMIIVRHLAMIADWRDVM
jgi:hypothetical protein